MPPVNKLLTQKARFASSAQSAVHVFVHSAPTQRRLLITDAGFSERTALSPDQAALTVVIVAISRKPSIVSACVSGVRSAQPSSSTVTL